MSDVYFYHRLYRNHREKQNNYADSADCVANDQPYWKSDNMLCAVWWFGILDVHLNKEQISTTREQLYRVLLYNQKGAAAICGSWHYFDMWIVLIHEIFDPSKYFGDVDPGRITNAGAVDISNIRVDCQDGVRAAQEIGTAGVAEAETTWSASRIQCEPHVFSAMYKITGDQLAWGIHACAWSSPSKVRRWWR